MFRKFSQIICLLVILYMTGCGASVRTINLSSVSVKQNNIFLKLQTYNERESILSHGLLSVGPYKTFDMHFENVEFKEYLSGGFNSQVQQSVTKIGERIGYPLSIQKHSTGALCGISLPTTHH